MICNRIIEHLIGKGFRNVKVNVPNIYVYYTTINMEVYVVTLYYCPRGDEYTKEQYDNIRKQLYHNFFEKYQSFSIRILNVIVTEHVNMIRNLNSDNEEQWIVDSSLGRLLLFENQVGEFLTLRKDIENILLQWNQSLTNQARYTQSSANSSTNVDWNHGSRNKANNRSFLSAYFSSCNTVLIILNIIIFLYTDLVGSTQDTYFLLNHGALYWPAVIEGNEYYRLLTYMFLHGGIEHLANNMIVLLFLGDNLERAAGKWKYLVMYFGSGILAGIVSMGYNMLNNTHAVSVGASGAIFGVVGAMAYIVIVNKGRLENISTRQLIVFVIFSLYGGLTSQGVDNAAHIGGLLAGAFIALLLYRKHKKKHLERGYGDES